MATEINLYKKQFVMIDERNENDEEEPRQIEKVKKRERERGENSFLATTQ